jgi:glycolate oxidase iron-sulfur subunit
VAIERIFPFPERLALALAPVKLARAVGLHRWGPRFIREALALVPAELDRVELPEFSPANGGNLETRNPELETPRAGFVSGCAMSVLFGTTNANSVRLLNRAGCDVVTPGDQACCGALHAHSGRLDLARQCARQNIEAFERANVDVVVINAAGCGSTLKEYGALLADDPAWAERAARFGATVKDLTEVLAPASFALRSGSFALRTCYHDACHLCHAQRITKQPRALVKAIAGENYVELTESDVCCGSAGTYNLTEPEMAARLQRRKIDHILASGAQLVVTTNPGCLLQIRAGLEAAGAREVRALHIADFLAENEVEQVFQPVR